MTILKQTTENIRRTTTEYFADDYAAIIKLTVIEGISEEYRIIAPDTLKQIAVIDYSMLMHTWYINGIYVGDNRTEYNFNRFYGIIMSVYKAK